MSRVALTIVAVFALQGPLCVLHCMAGPANATAAAPSCHAAAAADAPADQAGPTDRADDPLERCARLSQALSPEGSTLESGAHALAVHAPLPPFFSPAPAPLARAPLRAEARPRLYLATSQLLL